MSKTTTLLLALMTTMASQAQTLNVHVGQTVYCIPAEQAGDMIYATGSELTILDKTFALSDIDKIVIDESTVTASAVDVDYSGTSATVRIPFDIMARLTVAVNGAHVSIIQDEYVANEVTYNLAGSSTNGSFYMDGELKATVVLNGLTLNNPDSAAINIRDGKRINLILADGTTNTLTDGKNGSQKACLAVKGHTEIDGTGTLNLTGNTAHAFWGKEYVQLKKGAGTINITSAVGDGFNVNQYYQQNGGTVNISGVGDDGIQVSYKTDDDDVVIPLTEDEDNTGMVIVKGGTINATVTAAGAKGIKAEGSITIDESKATATLTVKSTGGVAVDGTDYTSAAAMKSDTSVTLNGGTLTLTATGQGGRAMLSEGTLNINGGKLVARAEGSNYGSSNPGGGRRCGGGWGGWGGWGGGGSTTTDNSKNAKGVKAVGAITISGGDVNIYSASHEGLESKTSIDITGGTVYVKASDDAINCSRDTSDKNSTGNFTISGGIVYGYSTNNDALDANGNMTISGGVAIGFGGNGAESGIDTDESHALTITGGQLFGIGGRTDTKFSSCTQSYGYSTSSTRCTSSNGYFVLSEGSTRLFAVKVPASYSGIAIVSSPSMRKGTTYTVGMAPSVSGTESNGFIESPTVSSVSNTVNITGR